MTMSLGSWRRGRHGPFVIHRVGRIRMSEGLSVPHKSFEL